MGLLEQIHEETNKQIIFMSLTFTIIFAVFTCIVLSTGTNYPIALFGAITTLFSLAPIVYLE